MPTQVLHKVCCDGVLGKQDGGGLLYDVNKAPQLHHQPDSSTATFFSNTFFHAQHVGRTRCLVSACLRFWQSLQDPPDISGAFFCVVAIFKGEVHSLALTGLTRQQGRQSCAQTGEVIEGEYSCRTLLWLTRFGWISPRERNSILRMRGV